MKNPLSLDRRDVLRAAAGLGGLALLPSFARTSTRGGGGVDNVVLLQLTGGNDGLSTLVPYDEDGYARARSFTRFTGTDVLRLDDHVGLHPQLRFLRELYDSGCAAVVQGVGYPDANRSHFKSLDIWHSASPDGRAAKSGWVGRTCEQAFDEPQADRVVHVGDAPPFSLYSRTHPAATFRDAEHYRFRGHEEHMEEVAERGADEHGGSALDHLRGVMRDAARSSEAIRRAVATHEPAAEYPRGALADRLRTASAIVQGGIGARVASVEQNGYDTHVQQRSSHDRLMQDLDRGLEAFCRDLAGSEAGRRTVVVLYSEFGRRVKENASRGTDHGAAGTAFVLCPPGADTVRGGLHGEHPSLDELDRGDLAYTTDFRTIYAALLDRVFGVPPESVLGRPFEPLPLFA